MLDQQPYPGQGDECPLEEHPTAAEAPVECSCGHFGAASLMGAGQLRIGLCCSMKLVGPDPTHQE